MLFSLLWSGCSRDPAAQEAKFLARGKTYMARKDYNRAILEFQNATRSKQGDGEPWYQLALAYLELGRRDQAVLALREATRRNPQHHDAQLKFAELMAQSSSREVLQEALKRLDQMLTVQPDDPQVLDALAMAEMRLQKPEDAEKHLKEALAKFPGHLASSAALAAIQVVNRQYDLAEQTLKDAVAKAPQSPEAADALAYLYLVEKKKFEAERELQRALQLKPDDSIALRFLASLQLSQGRVSDADQSYRRLAALPSGNFSHIHAAFLLSQGKGDEALAEFERLAKNSHSDHAAKNRLVAAYLKLGRKDEAVQHVTEMIRQNPKDTDALLFRSQIYLRTGKLNEAEKDILQVLNFNADSADAHYGLAMIYGLRGLPKSRIGELDKVIQLQPGTIGPRVELSREHISEGHPETALAVMDAAPAGLKETVPAIVGRNWALLALNRLDEVEAAVEKGFRVERSFDLLLQQGLVRLSRKDYPGSRSIATELLQARPLRVEAVHFAVQERVAQNQPAEALRILHEATTATPKSPMMQLVAGRWFLRLGDKGDARTAIAAAEAANPQYTAARMAMAELDMEEGQIGSARNELTSLIAFQPSNEAAQLMLANLEYKARNRASALEHYKTVLELNPDDVAALNAIAYLIAAQNADEALKYAQHAFDLAPNNPAVQDTLGWVYYRKGLYGKSVEYLALAASRDPSLVHQFHLAMGYLKTGDRVRGQEILGKVLAKDPNLPKTETDW